MTKKRGNADGTTRADCPASLNEVLKAELQLLGRDVPVDAVPMSASAAERSENLRQIYRSIHALSRPGPDSKPLAALCLSGGGIRSATFNLGVIQALAQHKLLDKFDYLSSVSGGGYIAAWLRTWIHRESFDDPAREACRDGLKRVSRKLANLPVDSDDIRRDPLSPEPEPLSNLRDFSNYLTPKLGFFSGDTWAAAAIIARNLFLNWLVLVPLMAAVVGIPLLFLLVVRVTPNPSDWGRPLLGVALGIEFLASLLVYCFRRFAKQSPLSQVYFIGFCVVPVVLSASALSTAALALQLPWIVSTPDPSIDDWHRLWLFAATWCIAIPLIGWAFAQATAELVPRWTLPRFSESGRETQRRPGEKASLLPSDRTKSRRGNLPRQVPWGWELLGLLVSGAVGMTLLVGVIEAWLPYFYAHPVLYVVFVLPTLLGIWLGSRALYVGVASLGETFARSQLAASRKRTPQAKDRRSTLINSDDSDREWWARLSGWVLLFVIAWIALTGVCLVDAYIPRLIGATLPATGTDNRWASVEAVAKSLVGAIGAISGLMAALTGRSPQTSAQPGAPVRGAGKRILAITGPLFVICLIIMLSWGDTALGKWITQEPRLFGFYGDQVRIQHNPQKLDLGWMRFPLILPGLAAISFIAGCFVNINRFSLHGMYRNRLVRAYLGASNCQSIGDVPRIPDPFTGFALSDNVALHALCPEKFPERARPLPIINTTLNLVHGDKLAWQQRKAESFSMTPLFCGCWREGYRTSKRYGGTGGITVGTAMTISGAAANPNMGYSSSPMLSFLMALFNVRLGAWLGNTNISGDHSYSRPGPRQALVPFVAEMFGLTNSKRSHINLSDGGHFDNLGLYEAVLRRCRYIVVSDVGQDESFSFEDLGNAIRKIRIDFGIDVVFEKKIEILPNSSKKKAGLLYAKAKIRYGAMDGDEQTTIADGELIYIKPSLRGRDASGAVLPYDIYSYAQESADFPHESTVDQWFSESQFESYRALGCHIVSEVASSKEPLTTLERLFKVGNDVGGPLLEPSCSYAPSK